VCHARTCVMTHRAAVAGVHWRAHDAHRPQSRSQSAARRERRQGRAARRRAVDVRRVELVARTHRIGRCRAIDDAEADRAPARVPAGSRRESSEARATCHLAPHTARGAVTCLLSRLCSRHLSQLLSISCNRIASLPDALTALPRLASLHAQCNHIRTLPAPLVPWCVPSHRHRSQVTRHN
jgi:hypothetical protein